ncbi:sedoheptulokinase-like isoform X2 [Dreissena polymorpha]|uniref:Carbohydrate kinase FGGY N-terminal domain-containing protein n=2 Tax=Dreissena polymorpha TaxID=45954 RepID=A0A9D4MZW8_DREPO|nr:sedoheptulokinase-like isoform X2 [Dreissena polymorpha]XP_052224181.1 sedoheptulokinase-like isoform X2 [Dreissena polymorpha]XP_052224188.1 sedoheptulokinase-like isoform X2 [Dreissena polymorpha]XP_052224194.1 sedoheptulokinase-like isoform X2 [Dreissena polymorpha]XP_052224201.1 sedoheptulokinase-like isoform X2 [Dreissena polymorpha]XP_052224208.1 sedoheptulokinase-like isoform X2 [Dreissena polymorpha]KAH3885353.1 hypothetical protein DPMN_009346 [Dreissena polymorpha]
MDSDQNLCLGIDLGTTSVKISIIDTATKDQVFTTTEATNAYISSNDGIQGAEQSILLIMDAICACILRATDKTRSNIGCIAVSGQMHGVVLWNSEGKTPLSNTLDLASFTSNLYTWEDRRATTQFLLSLPKPDSHQPISAGFGNVTLFWLARNEPELLVKYDTAGGVMDYLTTLLCGLDKPVMSNQIACSWGYFNCQTGTWNLNILKDNGFPVHLLPVTVAGGSKVGELCADWFGIRRGTPVLSGLGDLQSSFMAASKLPNDAVMNISTSSQIGFRIDCPGFSPPKQDVPAPVSYFPYFDNGYLAVAASLNGGNILKAFVRMLQQWVGTLGLTIHEESIWLKLTEIASYPEIAEEFSRPVIHPFLYGERYNPNLTASISGMREENSTLECIFHALCNGLVANLHQMMPLSLLIESGVERVVLTGSVISRQPHVMTCVKRTYSPLPVMLEIGAEASYGAALVAAKYLQVP